MTIKKTAQGVMCHTLWAEVRFSRGSVELNSKVDDPSVWGKTKLRNNLRRLTSCFRVKPDWLAFPEAHRVPLTINAQDAEARIVEQGRVFEHWSRLRSCGRSIDHIRVALGGGLTLGVRGVTHDQRNQAQSFEGLAMDTESTAVMEAEREERKEASRTECVFVELGKVLEDTKGGVGSQWDGGAWKQF